MIWMVLALASAGEMDAAWEQLAQVGQLEAHFEQTQVRAWLNEPLISSGTLSFTRPSSLVWTVELPTPSEFRLDGDSVSIGAPNGEMLMLPLDASPEVGRVVNSLTVWLNGDIQAMEENYQVTGSGRELRLVPRDATLREHLSSLDLTLALSGDWVERVVLTEPDDDTLTIVLSDVHIRKLSTP